MAINRDKVYDGAMKLLAQSKFDKAIAEFEKLVADDPKDVRTLLKIAETLHVKMGKRKEALERYDKAATIYAEQGFFLKAVAVFKQMLTVDATNPDLHLRLAELYQQLGYASQCLLHYQQVVVLYEQQGRGKETLAILKRMVDLDPENLQSRVKVAELFAQQGMLAEAAAEMRSAFDYLKAQQRLDDAVRVGEKVLLWDPNALDVARELANIYMSRGDAKSALARLQMCFRADPRNLEVLGLIANAFLALDQTQKTVSVYKEMARIHEGNNDTAQARAHWEKVLELAPGDEDAEIALGRRSATVVAAPVVAAPAVPAAPKVNPEDEQVQRLLTETDVYVKYGLRDKAIEHLDKIFAIRPDHIPALEKLKQLQTQLKQSAAVVETLKRLIARGEETAHPKLAEWKSELLRVEKSAAAVAPKPAPRPEPRPEPRAASRGPPSQLSSEGEVILVEEDAPIMAVSRPRAPTPPPQAFAQPLKKSAASLRGAAPVVAPETDAATILQARPPSGGMLASLPSAQAEGPARSRAQPSPPSPPPSPPPRDEPLDEPLEPVGRGEAVLPPDESLDGPGAAASPARSAPPEVVLEEPAEIEDADALVRAALGMPAPPTTGEVSAEGHPADELVLEQEDVAPPPAPTPPQEVAPTRAPLPPEFDESEIDALAAQAVREALPPGLSRLDEGAASTAIMSLSEAEMGELQALVQQAQSAEEPVVAAPPPALPADAADDFGDARTVAYDARAGFTPAALPDRARVPAPVADASAEAGALPARPSEPAPEADGEFNPDEFDLPPDVKRMLAQKPSSASLDEELGNMQAMSTGSFDRSAVGSIGSIPSLASVDAAAIEEIAGAPPVSQSALPTSALPSAPVADEADAGLDLPSQSRNLFAPERGFEDDPANTFFPDELAEAEFFIQQDLLDEAREILEPILEEVPDSLRVQHMLARVKAKENGEPEPPAPWEQKLIDDVAAQLDDLAAQAPTPDLPSQPEQVSVEEVLSQFKKGVAETVPEDDAATHFDLGIAYREMGLLDDAAGEFEIAARAPAKAADAMFLVGLVRLDQGRIEDALAALERAYHAPLATKEQRAAAEYQRGVILEEHQGKGAEALVCFKRSKQLGGNAPDLDRRITALARVHGDVEVPPLNGSTPSAPAPARAPAGAGRPKNIDYV